MTKSDYNKLTAILQAERERIQRLSINNRIPTDVVARISMYTAVTSIQYRIERCWPLNTLESEDKP